jgi:SHS2 domain-containing protein
MLERPHRLGAGVLRLPAMPSPRQAGHRQIDHTADLALEIWGPDEVAVLREAARAVVGIVTEQGAVGTGERRDVELEALDGADRLVRWINEILYLATVEEFVTADASVSLHEGGLRATLVGEAKGRHLLRTEIKSATYHDLLLEQREGGIFARVVMDV